MKRIMCILFLMINIFSSRLYAQTNLLENPGFEIDQLGYLAMWHVDSYIDTDEGRRVFIMEETKYSGKRSLVIVNFIPNDTKAVQWVKVEPNMFYKIGAWVMAEVLDDQGIGANLSVLGSITASADLRETQGQWQRLELIGKTGADQTFLGVSVRLGFYNNLCTGRAYFDDVVLEKLGEPPAEGKVVDFASNRGTGFITYRPEKKEQKGIEQFPLTFIVPISLAGLFGIVFLLLLIGLLKTTRKFPFVRFVWIKRGAEAGEKAVQKKGKQAGVKELRNAPRKPMRISIVVKKNLSAGAYRLIELKSINISESGLFLGSEDLSLFSLNESLEVQAIYRRKKSDLGQVTVVRKQETFHSSGKRLTPGFGLMFSRTTPAQKKNIKELVK